MRKFEATVDVLIVLGLVLILVLPGCAWAATITFTYTGHTLGGTIGKKAFAKTEFTLTGVGDTEDQFAWDLSHHQGFTVPHREASIALAGVGVYHLVTPTHTFMNSTNGIVGFSRGGDLFHGPLSHKLKDYDLTRSLSEIAGAGRVLQFLVQTTVGRLVMPDYTSTGTFAAHVAKHGPAPVPLPLPLLMLAMSIGALTLFTRGKAPITTRRL